MAENHRTRVLEVDRCGADIRTVKIERPAGYSFRAGQWFRLFLETRNGAEAHTFSHASTPEDDWVELTTRLSASAYKQALEQLEAGDQVEISGPGGRLGIPVETQKIAFLVGGVGITPARGLLRDAQQHGRTFTDAALIYGNRDETCEPYLPELLGMGDIGVHVVRVLERPGSDWEGERGFITTELVQRNLGADDGRLFMIAGPPVMVDVMSAILDRLEISPQRRIVEAFGPRVQQK